MDGASNSVSLPSASTRDVGDGPPKRFRNWPPTSLNKSSPLDGSSELSSELSCVKLNFAPLSQPKIGRRDGSRVRPVEQ